MAIVNFSLNNKIAVVIGGSKGIGRAIALTFAENGADLVISARGLEALKQTKTDIEKFGRRCHIVQADVNNDKDIQRIADQTMDVFGGIDILVTLPALGGSFGGYAPIVEWEADKWDTMMKVNLWAPFFASKLFYPMMVKRGGGRVIHMTSNDGIRPSGGLGPYPVSRASVIHLTRVCAVEWAPVGIRVNCIAPGIVRTAMAANLVKKIEETGNHLNPMKQIGEPEDIAGIALYLASDAGKYATGSTYVVDGGEIA
jgi:NAD(P)-dependent dehydrogenase (short-subunit alcohol dehydrogenase family)